MKMKCVKSENVFLKVLHLEEQGVCLPMTDDNFDHPKLDFPTVQFLFFSL